MIVGNLKPDGGNIIRQQGLRVARLSQNVPLDLNGSVFEVVAGGLGKLQIFLTQYHDISVRLSSGGERNRLFLAKLFTKSANILVLDEPTNDLSAETLEFLEELEAINPNGNNNFYLDVKIR